MELSRQQHNLNWKITLKPFQSGRIMIPGFIYAGVVGRNNFKIKKRPF
jgi:hypothetical protein